ncbi:MAG: preprotein translocase subunit SecG [candidate division Zixibacteria bacterium]|nr:preprotein translocase subunit SecG [candidate division Zixibacteria bacterium]
MFVAWVVFHVIVAAGLIMVVLLQSSKGEGLAGTAFGGGGGGGVGGAVFGGRGAGGFLSKATTALAVVFMINCIVLAFLSAGSRTTSIAGGVDDSESVVTRMAQEERERALEQQRLQQTADSASLQIEDASRIEGMSTSPAQPVDTGGQ